MYVEFLVYQWMYCLGEAWHNQILVNIYLWPIRERGKSKVADCWESGYTVIDKSSSIHWSWKNTNLLMLANFLPIWNDHSTFLPASAVSTEITTDYNPDRVSKSHGARNMHISGWWMSWTTTGRRISSTSERDDPSLLIIHAHSDSETRTRERATHLFIDEQCSCEANITDPLTSKMSPADSVTSVTSLKLTTLTTCIW